MDVSTYVTLGRVLRENAVSAGDSEVNDYILNQDAPALGRLLRILRQYVPAVGNRQLEWEQAMTRARRMTRQSFPNDYLKRYPFDFRTTEMEIQAILLAAQSF
jgi:hypothetical protein